MMKKLLFVALAIVLAFSISSLAFAQEKMEGKKEAKHELKSVSCDPTCGFMVRSHDEKELTSIVINHAKAAHDKDLTDKDVKGMMKPVKKMEKKMEEKKG
ncbi:MAG: DUF1059 domain-containing protein [Bacteroidota bacterium]